MVELSLQGKTYTAQRLTLRPWLAFEHTQTLIQKAVAAKDVDAYEREVHALVATVLAIPLADLDNTPWYEMHVAYTAITQLNLPRKLPMLADPAHDPPVPYDYPGRAWYWWLNFFARNYGWTVREVEVLDIDDAMSLLQECLVDQQHEREWQWSLSELAYPYNETTKKSVFKPLPQPAWMLGKPKVVAGTKVRFPKGMLPVGAIVGEDGRERLVH